MTSPHLNRRRFLTISAAALGLAASPASAGEVIRWQGRALGASASMILTGLSEMQARPILMAVEAELARQENIFSLYLEGSEIVRLNATGQLDNPSADMLQVLGLSSGLFHATSGAFDPSVQPVWQALAQGGDPARAKAAVGWQNVRFDARAVRFARPDMAITLNGVAQGFVTDRIAALLRREGLGNVLIDMGEIAAIGAGSDGNDWKAGVAKLDGTIVHHVALRNRALATSAPFGTLMPAVEKTGHIIDPRSVSNGPKQTLVSVSAPLAAVADGLSTACCLLEPDKARSVVAGFAGAKIELII